MKKISFFMTIVLLTFNSYAKTFTCDDDRNGFLEVQLQETKKKIGLFKSVNQLDPLKVTIKLAGFKNELVIEEDSFGFRSIDLDNYTSNPIAGLRYLQETVIKQSAYKGETTIIMYDDSAQVAVHEWPGISHRKLYELRNCSWDR